MSDFIYCASSPALPGVVRLARSENDPRGRAATIGNKGRFNRVEWVLRVADAEAALNAFDSEMVGVRSAAYPGAYRCGPMDARATAIRFTTLRGEEPAPAAASTPDILSELVLGLGLALQFLHVGSGMTGPSLALMVAVAFWICHRSNGIAEMSPVAQ